MTGEHCVVHVQRDLSGITYIPADLAKPYEAGGWLCGGCGRVLNHEDHVGRYEGAVFVVLGYVCPTCRHSWRSRPREKGEAVRQFRWQDLPATMHSNRGTGPGN